MFGKAFEVLKSPMDNLYKFKAVSGVLLIMFGTLIAAEHHFAAFIIVLDFQHFR